jgi:hypothetical protein
VAQTIARPDHRRAADNTAIRPFKLAAVPESELVELRRRIRKAYPLDEGVSDTFVQWNIRARGPIVSVSSRAHLVHFGPAPRAPERGN